MRYRPFGISGQAISALTLGFGVEDLSQGPEAARRLIFSALEHGINSFRLESADPALAEVLGKALQQVDRKLLQVSIMLGASAGPRGTGRDFSAMGITASIDKALVLSGLGHFDLGLLDDPKDFELPQTTLVALKALRSTGRVRLLGIAGDSPVMDTYVSTGAFDVLATPYHVYSPWQIRSRLRTAREKDMVIFVDGYYPAELNSRRKSENAHKPKGGLFGLFKPDRRKNREALAGAGTFAFLHRTPGWSAEQICLGYSLAEASIATVVVHVRDIKALPDLTHVTDIDMPAGLAAQIEMARIGSVHNAAQAA